MLSSTSGGDARLRWWEIKQSRELRFQVRLAVPTHVGQMLGRQLGRADRSEPKGAHGLPREQQIYVSISGACQAHLAAGALNSSSPPSSPHPHPPVTPRLCSSTLGRSSILSGDLEPSQSLPGCSRIRQPRNPTSVGT